MINTKQRLVGFFAPLLLSGVANASDNKNENYLFDENNLKQSCYQEFIEGERCWSSLPQFSTTHTTIEQMLSKLYPQYAKDTEAKDLTAFRYLERMFTLDPKTGDIIVAISEGGEGMPFDSLWGNAEKRQTAITIKTIENLVIETSDLVGLKSVLFDIYYDRATADFILANRATDKARTLWVDRASSASVEKYRQRSLDILLSAFDDYWRLVEKYPQSFASAQPFRDLKSARYLNEKGQSLPVYQEDRLITGYKDALLAYQFMNELLAQQLQLSKLKSVSASSAEQKSKLAYDASSLLERVISKETQLRRLLGDDSYTHIMLSSELDKFKGNIVKLKSVANWLEGGANYLGLPDDFVLLMPDYDSEDRIGSSSTEAIGKVLDEMTLSLDSSLSLAQKQHLDYRYQLDVFTRNFDQENQRSKERLSTLLGCPSSLIVNSCKEQTKSQRTGSLIGYQLKNIQAAKREVERAYRVHSEVLNNIVQEVTRLEQVQQTSNLVDKITVKLGLNEFKLQSLIDESRTSTFEMNTLLLSEEVQHSLDILDRFLNDTGSTDLSATFTAIEDLQGALKESSLDADLYTQKLALLERARIEGLQVETSDVFAKGRIQQLTLELATARADMAKSLSNLSDDAGRLLALNAEALLLVSETDQNEYLASERSYANPLSFSTLTVETYQAELEFSELQEWLFYAVQAFEHSRQVLFNDRNAELDKGDVFKVSNIQQSIEYLNALESFYGGWYTPNGHQTVDTISLKRDIFGYIDNYNGRTVLYPDPNGSGEMLNADEAFNAKLKLLSRDLVSGEWLTVEFSTVKNFPSSLLFQGPIVGSDDDVMCLSAAGTYSDKIGGVAIDLALNYDISGEATTKAYLTYGGNSYMRSSTPGVLVGDGEGLQGGLNSYSTRFADISRDSVVSNGSFRQRMTANLTAGYHDNRELLNPTYSFKERSVAASGWRLSLQLGDEYGDIVETEAIDDIQLVIQHQFRTRQTNLCSDATPL